MRRSVLGLAAALVLVWTCGCGGSSPEAQQALAAQSPGNSSQEFTGKTQPAPGRSGKLVTVVVHPVVEILVTPGVRVKKDQPLIRLDDDEPKADVRGKEAQVQEFRKSLEKLKAEPREAEQEEAKAGLESARVTAREARRALERITPAWQQGAYPESRHHEAQAALSKAEAEERAAAARLRRLLNRPFATEVAELEARIAAAIAAVDGAKAELEHYTIVAPIDGVVTSLDVVLGMAARAGTAVWGEVLDVRQLDVRFELTSQQLANVSVGQTVEVWEEGMPDRTWTGKVAFIGLAADPASGRIPVLVRVENPEEKLRCYVNVRVRLGNSSSARGVSSR
jgi:multidrug resistance efflux pump